MLSAVASSVLIIVFYYLTGSRIKSAKDLRSCLIEYTKFGLKTNVVAVGSHYIRPLDLWTLVEPEDPYLVEFQKALHAVEPQFMPGWLTDVVSTKMY